MELRLTDEQEMLRSSVQEFLAKECPESLVRQMEDDRDGYSRDLWQKIAGQDLLGVMIPESYGGVGLTVCELIVTLECFGEALVPGPFIPTVVLGGTALMEAGSEEQKTAYLPRIAAGDLVMTMAWTEPSAKWTSDGVSLAAETRDDEYVLNGTKMFVPDAHVSDVMVVVARTGATETNHEDGITLFLVDTATDGVQVNLLPTLAGDKQCEVMFEDVKVPASNVLGSEGGGWPVVEKTRDVALLAACAYLVGLSQRDFDITLACAKERVQFGRPIGSFQAIQHKLADAVMDVDSSRLITYRAAWSIAEQEPEARLLAATAKAWVSSASSRVVAHGQQIHGGIGFTKEYKIQLYFRRQKWMELMWGDADYHTERVGQLMDV